MLYSEARPSLDLAPFIRCFWALEYKRSANEAEPEPILPDGCPEIVFNLSDRFLRIREGNVEKQPTAILAGQMRTSIAIRPSGNVDLFGVRLQPAAATALVDFPLIDITDSIVEFGDAGGRDGLELEERINAARSFDCRVTLFETYLRRRLARGARTDPAVANAAAIIDRSNGHLRVSELAWEFGLSERRLERRFQASIGISPKVFSRIVRFQAVVRSIQGNGSREYLDAALDLGYYDQSHLIRDFRAFAGTTPQKFFERTHAISDVFTGAA